MADEEPQDLRFCPTRIDAAPVLFAHKVSEGQCQDRQRGQYHKCFTCAFNNAHVGSAVARPVALNGHVLAPARIPERRIQLRAAT